MSDVTERQRILAEAIHRVSKIPPGAIVTNICASAENPQRVSKFVRLVTNSRRNKYGIVHHDHWAQCTDGKCKWKTSVEVIYPGELDEATCEELFAPVWEAEWGKNEKRNE